MIHTLWSRILPHVLWLSALLAPPERARVRKLNGPLALGSLADVTGFTVAPGGEWIVYRADALQDERFELFVVPAAGNEAPRPLCGELPADHDVLDFQIAPDGRTAVYRAGAGTETAQLFGTPLDGATAPVRLHGDLPPGGGIGSALEIGPDGWSVVYAGDALVDGVNELFSAPLDGSTPAVRLNGPLVAGGAVLAARIAPDGLRVVYAARQEGPATELYAVPLAGGRPVCISGLLVAGGDVQSDFRIAHDGARVVYRADALVDERFELFVAPVDGGVAPLCLNAPLADDRDVEGGLEIDAPSGRVVFRVDVDGGGLDELHSVPLDGSAGAIRIDASVSRPGVRPGFVLASGAGRVVYLDRPSSVVDNTIYSVPIDGSAAPVQLDLPPRNTVIIDYACSADGLRTVFMRHDSNGRRDLLVAETDGSTPASKLDRGPDYNVLGFRVARTHVAYVAMPNGLPGRTLFAARLDGAADPVRLNVPELPLGEVELDLGIAGDDVVYRADPSEDDVMELLRVALDGSTPRAPLSGPGPRSMLGDVGRYALAGRNVIYLAEQEIAGVQELHSAPLDRSRAPVRLNDPLGPLQEVSAFQVSPDGTSVAFVANPTRGDRLDVFITPSDGSAPARLLDDGARGWGGVQSDLRFSPDARWIVYEWRESEQFDVHAVRSDGSAPPVSLYGSWGVVHSFAISPDSTRVVFRLGWGSDHRYLFSAPIDGSAPAVNLVSLWSGSDITGFGISADSRRIVYRADAGISDHFQLYSVPLEGGAAAIALQGPQAGEVQDFAFPVATGRVVFRANGPEGRIELYSTLADGSVAPAKLAAMGPHRLVKPFVLSPDGTRVAYRADADTDERFELFSVPSDGSAPPVKLSFATRRDTDVPAFAFTPDSRRVLYLADTLRNEQDDLYVVPADRSTPPRRLSPPLAPGRTLVDFACSPDGAWVAFRSTHDSGAEIELFRAPLDGSAAPIELSAPIAPGGGVRGYGFVSATELVYDADQDTDEVYELYASELGDKRRKAPAPPRVR